MAHTLPAGVFNKYSIDEVGFSAAVSPEPCALLIAALGFVCFWLRESSWRFATPISHLLHIRMIPQIALKVSAIDAWLLLCLSLISCTAIAQPSFVPWGSFQNFDFEAAMLQDVEFGMSAGPVASGAGIPSWTPYEGLTPISTDQIQHNGVSLGGPSIIIHGPQDSFDVIDGKYSLELIGGFGLAAIGQTGAIPVGSKSLLFSGDSKLALRVTFDGESLPVIRLRSGADFVTFGADVSFLAGKTGELRFTSTSEAYGGIIDDIRFSTVAIPEPDTATILLLGFCLFAGLRCREFRPEARDAVPRKKISSFPFAEY